MCYHSLFLFHQHGDLERAMLWHVNHNGAKFWRWALLPIIEQYRDRDIPKNFHGDAAFAIPAWRWLVLRRAAGKRLARYSVERRWNSAWHLGTGIIGGTIVRF